MLICPNCGNPCDDGAAFCNKCGAPFGAPNYQAQPMFDPADHTAEFDPVDISENKVIAMAPYLMGWVGIIVALLAINNSKYVSFNVKQALKLDVCFILSAFFCIIPFLGWLAFGVCAVIIFVLKIIGFVYVCTGKAKELPIIKKLGFLK